MTRKEAEQKRISPLTVQLHVVARVMVSPSRVRRACVMVRIRQEVIADLRKVR